MTAAELYDRAQYLYDALYIDKRKPVKRLDWIDRLRINQERADIFRALRALEEGRDYDRYVVSATIEQKMGIITSAPANNEI